MKRGYESASNINENPIKKRKLNNGQTQLVKPLYPCPSLCPISKLLEALFITRTDINKVNVSAASLYLFNKQTLCKNNVNRMFDSLVDYDFFMLLSTLALIYPDIQKEVESNSALTSIKIRKNKIEIVKALENIAHAHNLASLLQERKKIVFEKRCSNSTRDENVLSLSTCPISKFLKSLFLSNLNLSQASRLLFHRENVIKQADFNILFKKTPCRIAPIDLVLRLAKIYPEIEKEVERESVFNVPNYKARAAILEKLETMAKKHNVFVNNRPTKKTPDLIYNQPLPDVNLTNLTHTHEQLPSYTHLIENFENPIFGRNKVVEREELPRYEYYDSDLENYRIDTPEKLSEDNVDILLQF